MPTNNKLLAIIGTVGVPANYGGFETLAQNLVTLLNDRLKLTVYCSKKSYTAEERIPEWQKARLVYLPFNANGWQSIIYDLVSVIHAAFTADILLILGVASGFFLPIVKLFTDKPILINVDGIEWKRRKWGKVASWYLKNAEAYAVKYADYIIADNEVIKQYIQDEYGRTSTLIEYGGDHASQSPVLDDLKAKIPELAGKYAFKVCRIEPENNIEMILEAFTKQDLMPLIIIGNWQHSTYAQELYKKFHAQNNVLLLDPIYDPAILNQFRSNAFIYLHGHQSGGTNPSLVEAMHLRLPILAYDVNFNMETTENQALYFHTEQDILDQLFLLTEEKREEVSVKMQEICSRRYTWNIIAIKYMDLIEQCIRNQVATLSPQSAQAA